MAESKTLKELMTDQVEVISPGATVMDAARKMDELDVGALPVCENDRLVGIITDRDIVIRSVSAGQDPTMTPVRDAMTAPIIYCFDDQSLEEAGRLMEESQIRRLPVLNREKRLVGIVSLADLAVDATDEPVTLEVVKKVSEAA